MTILLEKKKRERYLVILYGQSMDLEVTEIVG
jgi:hypothetical protein